MRVVGALVLGKTHIAVDAVNLGLQGPPRQAAQFRRHHLDQCLSRLADAVGVAGLVGLEPVFGIVGPQFGKELVGLGDQRARTGSDDLSTPKAAVDDSKRTAANAQIACPYEAVEYHQPK